MNKKEIEQIIEKEFRISPAKRAAIILFNKGITEKDLNKQLSSYGRGIPSPKIVGVINELRDLEKGINKKS